MEASNFWRNHAKSMMHPITLIREQDQAQWTNKQSLSLNLVKAKFQTQRANQFSSSQVDGTGKGGVIKTRES